MNTITKPLLRAALLGSAALTLAACQAEEPEFEVDATDESGGELIAVPEGEGVQVDLPETEMTPVVEGAAAEDAMAEEAPAE
ncbi:hypothetical protein [Alteraurantiacibacter aquimixticola]|uniref:Argininosuccinate lyase n=1 Tax=Alteraurantiacibacter aquimixticola TaxID=2489173 RepID=A0A4T3EWM1_9SPHN|nr:hypothetical protein [Alteraurantiacibacter aquimixticola]TIX48873.1 hypothetical protein E5222_14115 [Alteraurantiacibacter aquimixticola]